MTDEAEIDEFLDGLKQPKRNLPSFRPQIQAEEQTEPSKNLEETIDKILETSIVVDDEGDTDNLGTDLKEISKELTDDRNAFRFSNTNQLVLFEDSLLGAIADRPKYNPEVRPRYEFIRRFRYHYHIGRSAIKSAQADRFKELAGSLLGFKALLEYREAGVRSMEGEQKSGIIDRLKKN